ncbi:MAG: hypothetical protein KatS3mg083_128 [Candidatus Dojkabacteria bacterium]|nr:MAG: hypothetical protein KatS3mg083_128 [Candidatus Dojkabacteria bacterium]
MAQQQQKQQQALTPVSPLDRGTYPTTRTIPPKDKTYVHISPMDFLPPTLKITVPKDLEVKVGGKNKSTSSKTKRKTKTKKNISSPDVSQVEPLDIPFALPEPEKPQPIVPPAPTVEEEKPQQPEQLDIEKPGEIGYYELPREWMRETLHPREIQEPSEELRTILQSRLEEFGKAFGANRNIEEEARYIENVRQEIARFIKDRTRFSDQWVDKLTDTIVENAFKRAAPSFLSWGENLKNAGTAMLLKDGRYNLQPPTLQYGFDALYSQLTNGRIVSPVMADSLYNMMQTFQGTLVSALQDQKRELDDLYSELKDANARYGIQNPITQELLQKYRSKFNEYRDLMSLMDRDQLDISVERAWGYSPELGLMIQDDKAASDFINMMNRGLEKITGYRYKNGILQPITDKPKMNKRAAYELFEQLDEVKKNIISPITRGIGVNPDYSSGFHTSETYDRVPAVDEQLLEDLKRKDKDKKEATHYVTGNPSDEAFAATPREYKEEEAGQVFDRISNRIITAAAGDKYDHDRALRSFTNSLLLPNIDSYKYEQLRQAPDPRLRSVADFYDSFWAAIQEAHKKGGENIEAMKRTIPKAVDRTIKIVGNMVAGQVQEYVESVLAQKDDKKGIKIDDINNQLKSVLRMLGFNPDKTIIGEGLSEADYNVDDINKFIQSRGGGINKIIDDLKKKHTTVVVVKDSQDPNKQTTYTQEDVVGYYRELSQMLSRGIIDARLLEKKRDDLNRAHRSAISDGLANALMGNFSGYASSTSPLFYSLLGTTYLSMIYPLTKNTSHYSSMMRALENINTYKVVESEGKREVYRISPLPEALVPVMLGAYFPIAVKNAKYGKQK